MTSILNHFRRISERDPTILAFISFVLLIGASPVAIRFSYSELPVFWSGAARFGLSAFLYWLLAAILKVEFPRGRALTGAVLFGVMSIGLGISLYYWGLAKTPASLFQIIGAGGPLLTLFFAILHGQETLRPRMVFGSLVVIAGITVAFGGTVSGELSITRIFAIVLGAALLAEASVIVKQVPASHPIAISAIALTIGTPIMATFSLLAGETWVLPSSSTMWWVFVYLVVGPSVISFLLYLYVLQRWTASATAYGLVLTPLVTVFVAATFAGEQITWIFVAGAALVLTGVWFGAMRP